MTVRAIALTSADAYQAALRTLARLAREFLGDQTADEGPLLDFWRAVARELRSDGFHRRERMTRAEVHRQNLSRLCQAIEEFLDLRDYDGGAVGLNIWEEFERAVRAAEKAADRYGPGDTTWAPEDDTNPFRTTPVPTPDPSAPAINGVRQGDAVQSKWDSEPRVLLTGADDQGYVRLSDPRDGGDFGGYFVRAEDLGSTYRLVGDVDDDEPVARPELSGGDHKLLPVRVTVDLCMAVAPEDFATGRHWEALAVALDEVPAVFHEGGSCSVMDPRDVVKGGPLDEHLRRVAEQCTCPFPGLIGYVRRDCPVHDPEGTVHGPASPEEGRA